MSNPILVQNISVLNSYNFFIKRSLDLLMEDYNSSIFKKHSSINNEIIDAFKKSLIPGNLWFYDLLALSEKDNKIDNVNFNHLYDLYQFTTKRYSECTYNTYSDDYLFVFIKRYIAFFDSCLFFKRADDPTEVTEFYSRVEDFLRSNNVLFENLRENTKEC